MRVTILLMCMLVFFAGCAAFQSSKKIDMVPFSDNAGVLFAEAIKVSRPFQFKNLTMYSNVQEYDEVKKKAEPLLRAMKGVVYYSHQVVVINNSKLKNKAKNEQLANYLQDVFEKTKRKVPQDSVRLYEEDVERVIDDIRNAKTYMDGIRAASPMINAIVLALLERLDEIEIGVTRIIAAFEREIDKEYHVPIENYLRLKHLQTTAQSTLTLLYLAMSEDRTIVDTLLQKDKYLSNFIKSGKNITKTQFENAEAYLVHRLERVDGMFKQLTDDTKEYMSKKDELSTWQIQADEKLSIARNAITVWSQSHRNLGEGIPVPPLIDIAVIAGTIIGSAQKAAK